MKYPILAIALIASTPAFATSLSMSALCETKSPALQTLGDAYYNIDDYGTLDPQKTQDLDNFYARLTGSWSGVQTDSYCVGTGNNIRVRQNHFLFKDALAELDSEGLFSIHTERQKIRRHEGSTRIDVLSYKPNYSLEFLPARSLVNVAMVNSNTVTMTTLYRQGIIRRPGLNTGNPSGENIQTDSISITETDQNTHLTYNHRPKASRLRERQDTLRLKGNQLSIETHWYVNGFYSGTESTNLTRD